MPYNNAGQVHIDTVILDIKSNNKNQVLQILATEAAAHTGWPAGDLCQTLINMEQEFSSGTGDGVAIPHIRLKGLKKPFVMLARLTSPIPFDAIDKEPVDLICLLCSPEKEAQIHLRRLSAVSRLLRDSQLREKLRYTNDMDTIKSMFENPEKRPLAA